MLLHWRDREELTKALDGAQSSSEKRRQEQWDCSPCLGPCSLGGLRSSQSTGTGTTVLEETDTGNMMRHGNTTNLDCGLTLNSIWTRSFLDSMINRSSIFQYYSLHHHIIIHPYLFLILYVLKSLQLMKVC